MATKDSPVLNERESVLPNEGHQHSPKVKAQSPKSKESPKIKGQSPKFRGLSLKHKGESPKADNQSPKRRGGSLKVGSESPKVRGESPNVGDQSPKVRSPSPPVIRLLESSPPQFRRRKKLDFPPNEQTINGGTSAEAPDVSEQCPSEPVEKPITNGTHDPPDQGTSKDVNANGVEGSKVTVGVAIGAKMRRSKSAGHRDAIISGDTCTSRAIGHVRGSSDSSRSGIASPAGSELSQDQGTSSSSSSLSQDASFFLQNSSSTTTRSMLVESLKAEIFQQRTSSDPALTAREQQSHKENDEVVTQLLEHIVTLKMELTTLKEENDKLKSVRSHMDDELHTLTENLFEEAYKMVDEAKGGKVSAEKRLADAAGKIDAMETEMSALKNLLQDPPPSGSPDKHSLHPHSHSHSPHHKHKRPNVKKAIRKLSKKAGLAMGGSSPAKHHHAPQPVTLLQHKSEEKGAALLEGQPAKQDYDEFSEWLEGLTSSKDHPYLAQIVDIDVRPCLTFKNAELSEEVLRAVEENNLHMESLTATAEAKRECALSGVGDADCTHRIKVGDSDQWHYISQQCRDRIAAACDFYMYVGHIQKGIIKPDASKLYWQVARLRALMALARLTLNLPEQKT